MTSDLCLLLGELHVVEDAEDDPEEVVPPVLLEGLTVTLHDLKHDGQTPAGSIRASAASHTSRCCTRLTSGLEIRHITCTGP